MELNFRSKQKPICAGISEGHADAAGIDDATAANRAVELHMRMAANNYICIRLSEDRHELIFRGKPSENVIRILRRSVTKENLAYSAYVHAQRRRPRCQQFTIGWVKLRSIPSNAITILCRHAGILTVHLSEHRYFSITNDELDREVAIEQPDESFTRHGTGNDVSADNDLVRASAGYVLQHRFQCREIAMNVIKRRDPHRA